MPHICYNGGILNMTDEAYYEELSIIDVVWKQLILDGELLNYDISNTGKYRDHSTGKIYKLSTVQGMKNTYEFAYIRLNSGKMYRTGIHRLVAIMFIPIPKKYIDAGFGISSLVVDHIDNVKYHNIYTNLQWLTNQENQIKSVKDDSRYRVKSIATPKKIIKNICKDLENGMTIYDISQKYNCSEYLVYRIRYFHAHTDISRKYHFPTVLLSDDTVKIICEKISNGETVENIVNILGVKKSSVLNIKARRAWTRISENYVFPGDDFNKDEYIQLIHDICKKLQQGVQPYIVARELGLKKSFVQHIASRETHVDISKKYIFTYSKCKVPDDIIHNICKDIESKKYYIKDISKRNNVSMFFVKCIKYRKHRTDISENYIW